MRFLPNATTMSAQRRKEHEVVSRCFGNGLMVASDCMSQAQSISVARRVSATERHERRPESGTAIVVEFDLMRSSAPRSGKGWKYCMGGETLDVSIVAGSGKANCACIRLRKAPRLWRISCVRGQRFLRVPKEPDGYEISSQRDNHVGTKAQGARSRVSLLWQRTDGCKRLHVASAEHFGCSTGVGCRKT